MAMWRTFPIAIVVMLISPVASAQVTGSVTAGYDLAREVCATCHAVDDGMTVSPNPDAPSFEETANKPGITALALTVWFKTPHPTMPNFIFSEGENDDLTAYILSLKND